MNKKTSKTRKITIEIIDDSYPENLCEKNLETCKKIENKIDYNIKQHKWINNIDISTEDDETEDYNTTTYIKKDITVKDITLKEEWNLWTHSLVSNDWTLKGYKKIFVITSVGDFWSIFNNFHKLGPDCFHIYMMKKGITPMWEDIKNRYGGICSIKIDFDRSFNEFEDICKRVILNILLTKENNDITGVSLSPKINSRCSFAIIKIWNSNAKNNIIDLLSSELKKKYMKNSLQYKENVPEY